MARYGNQRKPRRSKRRFRGILIVEIVILLVLFGAFFVYRNIENRSSKGDNPSKGVDVADGKGKDDKKSNTDKKLTDEEKQALEEQQKLKQEIAEREELVKSTKRLTLGYDYDGAIELIKSYQGNEGGYSVYPDLLEAIKQIEEEKAALVLYGGSYESVKQFNHIFFHSMIADNSKAFDGDYDSVGYNMYMTTVYEFKKMMEKLYEDGYILISIHDIVTPTLQEDGSVKMVEQELYLPPGKKPFVMSQDDTNYYDYMMGDGFATRLVLDENGKVTNEMVGDDGNLIYGAFDMVPIIDEFVEEHPDFSYKGAKGIIALTGYEGVMGYRTNDPESPTYTADIAAAKEVAEAMKANGWEFACHGWGHKNAATITTDHFKRDTQRWIDEVLSIIGPTDIYIFPYGVDFESTMGHYSSEKYLFAKEKGFNYFCGVDKAPWMHIKDAYVRMTRRPLDGQAMLQFPERLVDLFTIEEVLDPERPARNW